MKIGVTEAADAGRNLVWTKNIKDKDGLILITKTVTDEFIQTVTGLDMTKIILHATCTGLGGSVLEPGVFSPETQISQVIKLIDAGFPASHVVLRVDPIVPPYLTNTERVFHAFQPLYDKGCRRIRFSIMDMYPHVRARMTAANLTQVTDCYPGFRENARWHNAVANLLTKVHASYPDASIEACAETMNLPFVEQTGCCSVKDIRLMGLNENDIPTTINAQHRSGCHCLACKKELFPWHTLDNTPCPNHCIYCYWKTPAENQ